jgi:hypothetical protein
MTDRMRRSAFIFFLAAVTTVSAQWLGHPTAGIPRTADGKADLAAPAPRAADGKPDLSGLWMPEGDPSLGDPPDPPPRYFLDVFGRLTPKTIPAELQPSAAQIYVRNRDSVGKLNPASNCLPRGVPWADTTPFPYKILQMPGLVIILYEENTTFRQIFTDGRPHPTDSQPTWLGYSTGKWDANTLVVDTTGFNDRSWLDTFGAPHSDKLHLIERFRRRDVGHMEIEISVDDPKTYIKPVVFTQNLRLLPDTELLENFCENEKDVKHMVGSAADREITR